MQLPNFFYHDNGTDGLSELEGITDAIIEKINARLILKQPEPSMLSSGEIAL